MSAEIFVVRIVSCTNERFKQADKRDPVGFYVGNVRARRDGLSWLPMALVAAETCENYEEAVELEVGARKSPGFTFEIVRLAEPENPDAGALLIQNMAAAIRSHAAELEGIVRQWASHEPGGGQRVGPKPNLTPSWIGRFERWAKELRGVVAPVFQAAAPLLETGRTSYGESRSMPPREAHRAGCEQMTHHGLTDYPGGSFCEPDCAVFSRESLERAKRPNPSPVVAWVRATQHEDGTTTVVESSDSPPRPTDEDIARGMLGAVLGLSARPTWVEVERKIATTIESVDLLRREVQLGSIVVKRLAGAIRRHAGVLEESAGFCRENAKTQRYNVGGVLISVAERYERWVRELRELVAGIPE